MELVHLASLYHDDVMDEATMRRTVESVNARWGNLVAIVAGDFLLARSAEIAASLGTEIAGLLAHTLGQLCQGQVAEVRAAFSTERTEDHYFTAIAGKTAALMATSCRIGALTGALPRVEVEALTTFGRCFGMLFQLRDDVLDIIGTEEELGKLPGQDLAEGIYTLPVLKALPGPRRRPRTGAAAGQAPGPTGAGQGPVDRGRLRRHRRHRGRRPALRRGGGRRRRPPCRDPTSVVPWPNWPAACSTTSPWSAASIASAGRRHGRPPARR